MTKFARVMLGVCSALLFNAAAFAGAADDVPFHCYLTWQSDPTTTVTVNFHTVNPHVLPEVRFDNVSRAGIPAAYAFRVTAESHQIPGLNALAGAQRDIHVAELTGLQPGGVYYFVAGTPDGGYTAEHSVAIPSRDADDLRFVVGGDMGTSTAVPPLLSAAAEHSPLFGVVGGDIAYENGDLNNWALWDTWLTNWETNMVTPDGHSVPMILAIGNHEVVGGFDAFDDPYASAPFYFGLFAQDGHGFAPGRRAYFRRNFGPDVTLLVLDSRHVTPVDGAQRDWLELQLSNMENTDLRMAAYHVPMYPSHRSFLDADSAELRENWLPLFDEWGLDVAFEHHDHMLKRTKPLRANAPDPDGTIYLGDGCLGQTPRTGEQAQALETPEGLAEVGLTENYLAAWSSARHFWLAEAVRDDEDGPLLEFTALDSTQTVWDEAALAIEDRGEDDDDGSSSSFTCLVSVLFANFDNSDMFRNLRALRDEVLLPSAAGTMITDAYYRVGGPAAQWLGHRPAVLRPLQDMVIWSATHGAVLAAITGILSVFAAAQASRRVVRTA